MAYALSQSLTLKRSRRAEKGKSTQGEVFCCDLQVLFETKTKAVPTQ